MSLILEPCNLCLQIAPLDPHKTAIPGRGDTAVVNLAYRGYTCKSETPHDYNWYTRNLSMLFNDVPYLRMDNPENGVFKVLSSGDFKNTTLGSMPQIYQMLTNAMSYGIPVQIQPSISLLTDELHQLCNFLRREDYLSMPLGYFTAIQDFLYAYGMINYLDYNATDWMPFRSTISLNGAFTCFSVLEPAKIVNGYMAAMPF